MHGLARARPFYTSPHSYETASYGVEKNVDAAYRCYKEAADMGDQYGQHLLGRLYAGEVADAVHLVDREQAVSYFRRAARQGHFEARKQLELLLGVGTKNDALWGGGAAFFLGR